MYSVPSDRLTICPEYHLPGIPPARNTMHACHQYNIFYHTQNYIECIARNLGNHHAVMCFFYFNFEEYPLDWSTISMKFGGGR